MKTEAPRNETGGTDGCAGGAEPIGARSAHGGEVSKGAVAVTGIGVVSPLGIGRTVFWENLFAGQSGIAPIERFAVAPGAPRLAAEVRGFVARDLISSTHLRRMDALSRMLVAAGRLAVDDAHGPLADIVPNRVAVVIGSALGNTAETDQHLSRIYTKGLRGASPLMFPNLVLNAPASYLSMELGVTGANLTVSQGEASGEMALMMAVDLLHSGRADVALAGGADQFNALVYDAYSCARALSSQRGGREWCGPYDVGRNGLVLGEGAAILVLEAPDHARARGAHIYATIEDATSFVVESPLYDWPRLAPEAVEPLRQLLGGAGVELVCGCANGSRWLDACELDVLAQVLSPASSNVWLTSIKGAVGEFGGAGALTLAAAALAVDQQTVPPLCHLEATEPTAPFRFARVGTPQRIDRALCCGFARGGAAAALVLRRADSRH